MSGEDQRFGLDFSPLSIYPPSDSEGERKQSLFKENRSDEQIGLGRARHGIKDRATCDNRFGKGKITRLSLAH